MHPCHPGQLHWKRNEIISQPLPLRVAFLLSVQTTYCPRSPANSREQTDNAAAINKAALLHIHINQTPNSTTFFQEEKAVLHWGDGGSCQVGWCWKCLSPALAELTPLTFLPLGIPALGSSSSSPSAFLLPGSAELKGGIPKAAAESPGHCHCGETRAVRDGEVLNSSGWFGRSGSVLFPILCRNFCILCKFQSKVWKIWV